MLFVCIDLALSSIKNTQNIFVEMLICIEKELENTKLLTKPHRKHGQ